MFLTGCLNGLMDAVSFHSKLAKYSFWKFEESWKKKYKEGEPKKGRKFFGSRTIFVFLTDGWHLTKSLMKFCFLIAIIIHNPIYSWYIELPILWISFQLGFHLTYTIIFK